MSAFRTHDTTRDHLVSAVREAHRAEGHAVRGDDLARALLAAYGSTDEPAMERVVVMAISLLRDQDGSRTHDAATASAREAMVYCKARLNGGVS